MPKRPPSIKPARRRHVQADHDFNRGSAAARGYDAAHRRWRLAILRRDPLCVLCLEQGRTSPATVADHVVPIAIDATRRLALDNGRGLCVACHGAVTDNFKRTGENQLPKERR